MIVTQKLPVKGAYIVKTGRFVDHRGCLGELYNHNKYPEEISQFFPIKQTTIVSNRKGALRGFVTASYAKLLSCAVGAIYDVVVDLRKSSPTYLNWSAVLLTASNGKQLFVPPDCAHGYYAVEKNSIIVYNQGGTYDPNLVETRLHPLDTVVNVHWPIPEGVIPIMSEKDMSSPGIETDGTILESRSRVLVLGTSSPVGVAVMEYFKAFQSSLQVFGASETSSTEGIMDFDVQKAALDDSYCEEVLTICHPHILIFALPGEPRIVDVLKNFCKVNKNFNSKIIYCSSSNITDEDSNKMDEISKLIPGAVVQVSTSQYSVNLNNNNLITETTATDTTRSIPKSSLDFENFGKSFFGSLDQAIEDWQKSWH